MVGYVAWNESLRSLIIGIIAAPAAPEPDTPSVVTACPEGGALAAVPKHDEEPEGELQDSRGGKKVNSRSQSAQGGAEGASCASSNDLPDEPGGPHNKNGKSSADAVEEPPATEAAASFAKGKHAVRPSETGAKRRQLSTIHEAPEEDGASPGQPQESDSARGGAGRTSARPLQGNEKEEERSPKRRKALPSKNIPPQLGTNVVLTTSQAGEIGDGEGVLGKSRNQVNRDEVTSKRITIKLSFRQVSNIAAMRGAIYRRKNIQCMD